MKMEHFCCEQNVAIYTVRCLYNYFPIFSCWLSTDGRPVIWAFAAPMIAIVLVGTASTIVQQCYGVSVTLGKHSVFSSGDDFSCKEQNQEEQRSAV